VLPRSFPSGSLIAAAIKPSIEEYTYSVVVFNGNCSGIDVRFFPSQETITPESNGFQRFKGSEVQLHFSEQAVGKLKQQEKVIRVRPKSKTNDPVS